MDLNGSGTPKRRISAHRLPGCFPLPRPLPPRDAPQAAFLAQLLATGTGNARGEQAATAYRLAEASDAKRLPMGYRKTVLA